MEKCNDAAKMRNKVNFDSIKTLCDQQTPSRFLNLNQSQNEETENDNIFSPSTEKRNEDTTIVVQSPSTEETNENNTVVQTSICKKKTPSSLEKRNENPLLVQSSINEETPLIMLKMIKKTEEAERITKQKTIQNDEGSSFDLKISQMASNEKDPEVEDDTSRNAAQSEDQKDATSEKTQSENADKE
ncbi:hypothetical protein Hanom_Chr05g00451311 [Helianthus anomalus]